MLTAKKMHQTPVTARRYGPRLAGTSGCRSRAIVSIMLGPRTSVRAKAISMAPFTSAGTNRNIRSSLKSAATRRTAATSATGTAARITSLRRHRRHPEPTCTRRITAPAPARTRGPTSTSPAYTSSGYASATMPTSTRTWSGSRRVQFLVQQVDDVLDRPDGLQLVLGDLEIHVLLEPNREIDEIEAIELQVLHQPGGRDELVVAKLESVHQYLAQALEDLVLGDLGLRHQSSSWAPSHRS